jgi:hypothetical protein
MRRPGRPAAARAASIEGSRGDVLTKSLRRGGPSIGRTYAARVTLSDMASSPYRLAADASPSDAPAWADDRSCDLVPLGVLLWVSSVARVVGALAHHEILGAEPTLACLAAVSLPSFACAALVDRWGRRRARRTSGAPRHGRARSAP